jgi:enoyl-[acyl-carrier protein] reductase I
MGLFTGKKGIIMGVANEHSLAAGVAEFLKKEGAEIGLSHLPDKEGGPAKMLRRVMRVAEPLGIQFVKPCDVSSDVDIERFFADVREHFGVIDFFVHSIAYAPMDDIKCPTIDASRAGFLNAMDISCYSFIACARAAAPLMERGGAMATMTYYGGERVVGGYNLMGLCKAALESATKYLAWDLGPRGIRVNAVSAGPVKTLASSAVGAGEMLNMYESIAPLGRNITAEEVGKSTGFLLSDLASATTGETFHVDCGYHVMGSPGRAVLPPR